MALPELSDKDRNWYILKGYEIDEHVDGFGCIVRIFTIDGENHRDDGPAVEYSDGSKEYYLLGEYIRYPFLFHMKSQEIMADGSKLS